MMRKTEESSNIYSWALRKKVRGERKSETVRTDCKPLDRPRVVEYRMGLLFGKAG
jgi:hypothetical protein